VGTDRAEADLLQPREPRATESQDGSRTTTNTRRADEGSGNLAASPVSAFHCAAVRPAD
jgi:hypothetical protein